MSEFPRGEVERRTGAGIVYLGSLPRWIPFIAVLGLLAVAFLAGDGLGGVVGFLCLGLLAALLAWLAYASWPRLDTPARAIRVLAVLAVGGLAVSFLLR